MRYESLTLAERRFRVWMLISAWMYALAGLFFLFGGGLIVQGVNAASTRLFLSAPLYPQSDGQFWLALSLSMMAMITYICRAWYLDPRGNGRLIPILLLSKFCSSVFYIAFFIRYGQLAHLVGFLTDGPLFLATLALWIPASAGDGYISEAEEEILAAIGDAMLPRGGAFEVGYADFRDECLADARRMFATHSPATLAGTRIIIRVIDLAPIFLMGRPITLRRLPLEKRQALLSRIEHHRSNSLRMMFYAVKFFVTTPFFNREEAARAVGYVPAENAE